MSIVGSKGRAERARSIARAGGVAAAVRSGAAPRRVDVSLSEAVVLGLLCQGVRTFVGVFGHGTTDIGEVLRVYEEAGLIRTFGVRHETEAVHAASALRRVTGEKAAVFTSIGPGALHALAGSIVPASDGIGVWFLLGDETTEDEGPNMQQIPRPGQNNFHRLFSAMGDYYPLTRWQRCTVHFYRNVFGVVPRKRMAEVAAMLKAVHASEDLEAALEKAETVCLKLEAMKLPKAAEKVRAGISETLTYYHFPREHWRRIRTNNGLERIMKEIRRRTRVVGAFPDGHSALMLCAARLRHIAGTIWGRKRYLNMDLLKDQDLEEGYNLSEAV